MSFLINLFSRNLISYKPGQRSKWSWLADSWSSGFRLISSQIWCDFDRASSL